MESTVKGRLLEFLEAENESKAEFCRKMGLSTAYVGAMRKSLPEEKVLRMSLIYPRLNRDWLLYGEGSMYNDDPRPQKHSEFQVPLLPVEAFAGNLQEFSHGVKLRECDMITVPVRGADMAIPISGDSMEPEIKDGSVAVVCRINDRAFIPWGHPMIIDTENGVLLKVVYPSEQGSDFIEAHSYNPKYPDLQIPKASIFGLYRIVAYIRQVSTL